jgi:D-amino peptidase
MLVVVSADMEGASQLRGVREIFGCFPEYWNTGKPRLEADVAAACEGLLAGGASEVVVTDNHGGNTINVSAESLPPGARLETWNGFDLEEHGAEAMFQVGYHPRGGVDGFLSHTYIPGLRLRVGGELISESHGKAWAAEVPLLGIVGNDRHRETLGSLADVPFLVVQESVGRSAMRPVFQEPQEGLDAIRAFAEACARDAASSAPIPSPTEPTFEASMPNGSEAAAQMVDGGWTRVGEVEFSVELAHWRDAREPLTTAMNAALSPFMPYWLGAFADADEAAGADQSRVAELGAMFDAWAEESQPEWYTEPARALPPGAWS